MDTWSPHLVSPVILTFGLPPERISGVLEENVMFRMGKRDEEFVHEKWLKEVTGENAAFLNNQVDRVQGSTPELTSYFW